MSDIILPEWFDELAQFEAQYKGHLPEFNVSIRGRKYSFTLYDPVRLVQDVASVAEHTPFDPLYFPHLAVLLRLDMEHIMRFLHAFADESAGWTEAV
ncbi:hypothetical protein [Neisseria bacilliformis]|uniref:hypothetical protein n=1 Tax=Neisseria bacilliformis TaxID=267212 RepID=UPI0028E4E3F4|nr:hypothetical protein [Neisseria bacilliformis]